MVVVGGEYTILLSLTAGERFRLYYAAVPRIEVFEANVLKTPNQSISDP